MDLLGFVDGKRYFILNLPFVLGGFSFWLLLWSRLFIEDSLYEVDSLVHDVVDEGHKGDIIVVASLVVQYNYNFPWSLFGPLYFEEGMFVIDCCFADFAVIEI